MRPQSRAEKAERNSGAAQDPERPVLAKGMPLLYTYNRKNRGERPLDHPFHYIFKERESWQN